MEGYLNTVLNGREATLIYTLIYILSLFLSLGPLV